MSTDDERLLVEAAQADPARFVELYDRSVDRVYAYVSRRTGSRTVAGPDGEFAVPGLAFGRYTLRVQPPGGTVKEVAATYAADHQRVTVVLQP